MADKKRERTTLRSDFGKTEVLIVHGPKPYLWIGDAEGNFIDTVALTPAVRRKFGEARHAL